MKKYSILFVFCCCISVLAFAQVSINTNSPKGVFYIDGGADNSTTSANRFKNDVMVDSLGSLILGQATAPLTGKAKIDITSDAAYGAFRMKDGGEGNGMVLLGDANGDAKWGMLKGSGGYKLSITAPSTPMLSGSAYSVSFSNGFNYIPITQAGSYIVMIRMTVLYSGAATRAGGYFYLYKNAININALGEDSMEFYSDCINGQNFSMYAVLRAENLVAGDKIYWVIRPVGSSVQWTLNTSLTTVFFYRV